MNVPPHWSAEIETNRQTLRTIIATLCAWVRLAVNINHKQRLEILRTLRPAEAATRRLIVMAARGLVLKPTVHRPMPLATAKKLRTLRQQKCRRLQFQLSDPKVQMAPPTRKKYAKFGPRISIIQPVDPTVTAIFHALAPKSEIPPPQPRTENPTLTWRLEAIQAALENIPRQANRYLRWKARREKIATERPIQTSPLRPGRAPYAPKTPTRDVHFILERCHLLARETLKADTS
jgi:hypothetical protein